MKNNYTSQDWVAIGLLVLVFVIVFLLAGAVYLGHPLLHVMQDKEVLTFIIGVLAGWLGGSKR